MTGYCGLRGAIAFDNAIAACRDVSAPRLNSRCPDRLHDQPCAFFYAALNSGDIVFLQKSACKNNAGPRAWSSAKRINTARVAWASRAAPRDASANHIERSNRIQWRLVAAAASTCL